MFSLDLDSARAEACLRSSQRLIQIFFFFTFTVLRKSEIIIFSGVKIPFILRVVFKVCSLSDSVHDLRPKQ